MIYYKDGSNKFNPTDAMKCHYGGQVYYFENLYEGIEKSDDFPGYLNDGKFSINCNGDSCTTKQSNYTSLLKIQLGLLESQMGKDELETLIAGAAILEI
jgi:hypothetical protein